MRVLNTLTQVWFLFFLVATIEWIHAFSEYKEPDTSILLFGTVHELNGHVSLSGGQVGACKQVSALCYCCWAAPPTPHSSVLSAEERDKGGFGLLFLGSRNLISIAINHLSSSVYCADVVLASLLSQNTYIYSEPLWAMVQHHFLILAKGQKIFCTRITTLIRSSACQFLAPLDW
ncbi:uncharacterized protein LOC127740422 [Arachis duranensis]|uniref:Uncharacterized protein LOC127740422 n=1 Tax=Arachis duranensis TaxID=130453 RepID=A0A9C6WA00_ARADU|nr:uncharacterized protein LOC127740422 [Arachis duranensis]